MQFWDLCVSVNIRYFKKLNFEKKFSDLIA